MSTVLQASTTRMTMFKTQSSVHEHSKFHTPPRHRPTTFLRNLTLSSPYRHPQDSSLFRPATPPTPTPQYSSPEAVSEAQTINPSTSLIVATPFDVTKPDDPMPFRLRNPCNGKVRRPTNEEFQRIKTQFPQCTGYKISGPVFVLQCPQPPDTTPLTVAGLPAVFLSDMRDYDDLGGVLGNPRLSDIGGSEFRVEENRYPSFALLESAFKKLSQSLPNVVKLHFRYTHWIVTLSSSYFDAANSPGKFGKRPVVYTWPGQYKSYSRPRLMTPSVTTGGDITDYRAFGLTPGVKVVGKRMATSSGVIVQNGVERRLTLADHGFSHIDEVYHPDVLSQWLIGSVELRFPLIDVALCRLVTPLNYSNKQYFTANPPKRFVTTSFVDEYITKGAWFEAEGFTSGRVHMFYCGPAVGYPGLEDRPHVGDPYLLKEYQLEYFGPEVGDAQEGLCGAPVVYEKTDDEDYDGIVLGFVWMNCGRDVIVAAVDELLESGWEL